MNTKFEMHLSQQQIKGLSSVYIDEGVKKDGWQIHDVKISDALLTARVSMTSFFISPTDAGGFHLSIFSTQEFLAQLANIYMHLWAGYSEKSREAWMRECTITSRSTIRESKNIKVEMNFVSRKKRGDNFIAMINCRVYDDHGGLFTAKIKGLLR